MSKSITSCSPAYAGDPTPRDQSGAKSVSYAFFILIRGSKSNFNGWTNSYPPRMHWKSPRSRIKIKSAAAFNHAASANSVCGCLTAVCAHICSSLLMSGGFVLRTWRSATSEAKGHQHSRVTEYELQCGGDNPASENASRTRLCVLPSFLYLRQTPWDLDLSCWPQQKQCPSSFPCTSPCFS